MTDDPLTGDAYFLGIAKAVAAGAKCTRRQVGSVIVNESKHIVATGKNGSPPGHPECTDGACPRGKHAYAGTVDEFDGPSDICLCGEYWPCPEAVPPDSSYDTGPGRCIAVHSELNCLLNRTVPSVAGCTMYVTDNPCDGCWKAIRGACIARVVTPSSVTDLTVL